MRKTNGNTSNKVARTTMVAAKVGRVPSPTTHRPTQADVALRAYEIYQREGRPEGRHLAHWQLAEAELGPGA